ncbi:MAG: hypothetical protein JSW18_02540, partial [Candidatus Omnitrophota bacterium]
TKESYAETREEMITINENAAMDFMQLVLLKSGMHNLYNQSYPKRFSDFMEGYDMGGDIGKIAVSDSETIELVGYRFRYYHDNEVLLLSAEPISPGITGKRYFAVGQKPDGTGYIAEDINKNSKADVGEPQLLP